MDHRQVLHNNCTRMSLYMDYKEDSRIIKSTSNIKYKISKTSQNLKTLLTSIWILWNYLRKTFSFWLLPNPHKLWLNYIWGCAKTKKNWFSQSKMLSMNLQEPTKNTFRDNKMDICSQFRSIWTIMSQVREKSEVICIFHWL
jgi:hypothetical protein